MVNAKNRTFAPWGLLPTEPDGQNASINLARLNSVTTQGVMMTEGNAEPGASNPGKNERVINMLGTGSNPNTTLASNMMGIRGMIKEQRLAKNHKCCVKRVGIGSRNGTCA